MSEEPKPANPPSLDEATMEEGRALARQAMEAAPKAGRREDAPLRAESFTFRRKP